MNKTKLEEIAKKVEEGTITPEEGLRLAQDINAQLEKISKKLKKD